MFVRPATRTRLKVFGLPALPFENEEDADTKHHDGEDVRRGALREDEKKRTDYEYRHIICRDLPSHIPYSGSSRSVAGE